MPITRKCDRCGTSYTRSPALIGKYCSAPCGYAARRKETVTAKYRMLYKPDHPLATNSPYIPEHRVILWEAIGAGDHLCHRCGRAISWAPGDRTKSGSLVVDHLDRDSHNNAIENLAASCQSCNNRNRPDGVGDEEPYRIMAAGHRARGERRECCTCGNEFVTWPVAKAHQDNPNRGRFCSRSCARRAPK
jgi:5-methylcytosine-specific restriction endonuclease McrA